MRKTVAVLSVLATCSLVCAQTPPVINAVCPGGVTASGASLPAYVLLIGSGFVPPSAAGRFDLSTIVEWNNVTLNAANTTGSVLATTPNEILLGLNGSALAVAQQVTITATNPNGNAGGPSTTASFSILPPPVLTALNPVATTVGAPLTMTVTGATFLPTSPLCPAIMPLNLTTFDGTPPPTISDTAGTTLYWNGNPSNATLTVGTNAIFAVIPPALLTTPGTVNVAVRNPGSSTSNASDGISNSLQLLINPPPVITTATLPTGVAGKAFPATPIFATGGTPPFAWSVSPANIGLFIDANGVLQGVLNAAAASTTLQVSVRDAASVAATRTFNFAVLPTVPLILSVQGAIPHGQQGKLTVSTNQPLSADVTGNLSSSFALDGSVVNNTSAIDPVVANGALSSTTFVIPAGATTSSLINVIPGLAAGILTVRASNVLLNGLDITSAAQAPLNIPVNAAAPAIDSACITGLGTGTFSVRVIGSSSTRQVLGAQFALTGNKLAATTIPQNGAKGLFDSYYSTNFTAFNYTQTFEIFGVPGDVSGVSVSLSNALGSSTLTVQQSCQ